MKKQLIESPIKSILLKHADEKQIDCLRAKLAQPTLRLRRLNNEARTLSLFPQFKTQEDLEGVLIYKMLTTRGKYHQKTGAYSN